MNIFGKIQRILIFALPLTAWPAHSSDDGLFASARELVKEHPYATAGTALLVTSCCVYKMQAKKDKKDDKRQEMVGQIIKKIKQPTSRLNSQNDFTQKELTYLASNKQTQSAFVEYQDYLTKKHEYESALHTLHFYLVKCNAPLNLSNYKANQIWQHQQCLEPWLIKELPAAKKSIEAGIMREISSPQPDLPLLLSVEQLEKLKQYIACFNATAHAYVSCNKNAADELIAALKSASQPEFFFTPKLIGTIVAATALGIAGGYGLYKFFNR